MWDWVGLVSNSTMGMFRLRGCAGNWVTIRPPPPPTPKQSHNAVRHHTHPVVSFLNFKNQELLLFSSPSFLLLFSLSYLIILASVLFYFLLSDVCFALSLNLFLST